MVRVPREHASPDNILYQREEHAISSEKTCQLPDHARKPWCLPFDPSLAPI